MTNEELQAQVKILENTIEQMQILFRQVGFKKREAMTKEKVLKLQLNAARMEIEDLARALEELEERCKLLLAHVKSSQIPPPSAFKWEDASPIIREQVEAAI